MVQAARKLFFDLKVLVYLIALSFVRNISFAIKTIYKVIKGVMHSSNTMGTVRFTVFGTCLT